MKVVDELREMLDEKDYLTAGAMIWFGLMISWFLIPLWLLGWTCGQINQAIHRIAGRKAARKEV